MASLQSSSALESETTVVVAVRRSSSSRRAAAWASDHLGALSCRILLVHVIPLISFIPSPSGEMTPVEKMEKEVVAMYKHDKIHRALEALAPLKQLFGRRNVEMIVLEGHSPAATLVNYISENGIRNLVMGASSFGDSCFRRIFNQADVASTILEKMPSHCNVIIVSKKRLKMKISKLDNPIGTVLDATVGPDSHTEVQSISHRDFSESERKWFFREQFMRIFLGGGSHKHEMSRLTTSAFMDTNQSSRGGFSGISCAKTPQAFGAEDEVLKLRTDLQNTLAMYDQACEDLVQAKKKIQSLSIEHSEEAKKVQAALQREAKDGRKQLTQETLDRYRAEIIANQASMEKSNVVNGSLAREKRCRRYSQEEIEEATDNFSAAKKIGEGSYGNVYRCTLDHTEVAIKVLKQDSKEKMEEFLRELMFDIVPDGLTEYNETILVGTLYYMDPEYQRTGTVRPKSDLYALGVITLQLLTGRHPNGLLMSMERAVENGSLAEVLDKSVHDWPVEAAERLVKLSLRCSQLRCRDRPDLEDEFLPEMEEIMRMATGVHELERFNMRAVPKHFICPILNV
ncbi:U-box domain-containing protein 34 [Carex littledalei]|uniref:RING-type E3 ubiquitin transferase n=1 Tax=Carex littledalei TaxID=544730 RepID=A0A833QV83_9POAL|nr:U-box domain-containing protein 34 [Carex littledalei]